MCGRYTLGLPNDRLVEEFEVGPLSFDYAPRFNISPGQAVPVIAEDHSGRRMGLLTWGLVPRGSGASVRGFVNARAETLLEKPSFRDSARRRRCLVVADGFYEWKRDGETKTPFWFYPPDRGAITFAGIWDRWSHEGEVRHTFAIVTREASVDVAPVHHRMPVIVPAHVRPRWSAVDAKEADVRSVLDAAPGEGGLRRHEVSRRVNSSREDGIQLTDPV